MAFLGKDYTLVKQENFEAFLKATGVPDDRVAAIAAQKPSQKLTQSGDSYTLTNTGSTGPTDTIFKSGVEFDDFIGEDNTAVKSTITVDGNTLNQVIKGPRGQLNFKREFNGNDLVVTITAEKFDGVAKRYYKA